jgi:hypothetical protein
MAANAKQGTYLGTTLTGFTTLVAGLLVGGGIGIVVAIVGAGLVSGLRCRILSKSKTI